MTPACLDPIALVPGQPVVVVGAARSGLAAARLLSRMGMPVRLVDLKPFSEAVQAEAATLGWELVSGPHSVEQFAGAQAIIPSPGVPLPPIFACLNARQQERVMGELELAFGQLHHEPILAVTGTSGKTTTVSLAAAMLEEAGRKVFLGGNIGTPLSEYILGQLQGETKADVLVLEVSSFQLQTCRSFRPYVAVLLNISENHLDQHADMAEYQDAKFRLFMCQEGQDIAILSKNMENLAHTYLMPERVEYFSPQGRFPRTRLLGEHNQANLEAAWQACAHFGVTFEQAAAAAAEFAPLPHRLEVVAEKNNVLLVNDSKSTTVDSLRVALKAVDRPVLLLAGGVFKGGDLKALLPLIREKVREVALFGANREVFSQAWQGEVELSWFPDMGGAVRKLWDSAQPGDVILLSPATASFDLYKNYKARGDDFCRLAGELS